MKSEKKIGILYEDVSDNASYKDGQLLGEVEAVSAATQRLGYKTCDIVFSLNIADIINTIKEANVFLVFNLIQFVKRERRLAHLIPAILESHRVPYTGAPASTILSVANRISAKKMLKLVHINTPPWQTIQDIKASKLKLEPPVIIKPIWTNTFSDMEEGKTIYTNMEECIDRISQFDKPRAQEYYVESYVEGREMNVSLLASEREVQILPPAEIVLANCVEEPDIKEKAGKKSEASALSRSMVRKFEFDAKEKSLVDKIRDISLKCWNLFDFTGYAHISLKIDTENHPWVININANPSVSPKSDLVAAALKAGYTFEGIVSRIIDDAYARLVLNVY